MSEPPEEWGAMFWDIGGVILAHDSVRRAHEAFVESLVAHLELSIEPERAAETWRGAVGRYFREREGTEFRSAEEAYRRGVAAVAGDAVAESTWYSMLESAFLEHVEPEPDAIATVQELADREIHLGIVSDIDQREADMILAEFGLTSAFDSVTTSEEVGRTKPDQQMFETALAKASVRPDRALMIGDRYSHDVKGGADAGMWTIAYGAEDGPAVDFRVAELPDVLDIVDGTRDFS